MFNRVSDEAESTHNSEEGLFQSPLVTRSFSYFLQRSQGSVIDYGHPHGGLLLAVLMIERALCIYVQKKGGPIPAKGLMGFSEAAMRTWMSYYQDGIRSLDDEQWNDIVAAANEHDLSQSFVPNPTTPQRRGRTRS
ncbi:hypothetical protein K474DRAFT_1714342 [Panus rudis PR-1116 ss-1]|nr:hypothetical protein K474DRAFT_1714342 [Panus rudis PR-1116 ss-1]